MTHKHSNQLIHESSPYLLQHAHNPVNWYPWGKDALEKAKKEDKPIILSIGYSACHWCHVMERESFEDQSIASVMNEDFVCIKVDREERPDVDQVYMDAIQTMGLQGGWPLNVFLTPEQKPFYGGTYFPPQHWAHLLQQVSQAFKNKRDQIEESSEKFAQALSMSEVQKYGLREGNGEFSMEAVQNIYKKLSQKFDRQKGGLNRAPKFPMPSNWLYLINYYALAHEASALKQVELTLDEMAKGGIYDHLGGGFARYSVDENWLVPHFEKMLYDNGQLISLYAQAYKITGREDYREVVYQSVNFLEEVLTSPEGGFYSALDADSEGEEGKFYVWEKSEIDEILREDASLFNDYYRISEAGNWEEGKNIPHVRDRLEQVAEKHGLSGDAFRTKLESAKEKLKNVRDERVKPGLDNKILAGWNGLALRGLVDAFSAFREEKFLRLANRNARYIEENLCDGEKVLRIADKKNGGIYGYLEDYAFIIDAYAALYQVTFDEHWLDRAVTLTQYTIDHFYDQKENFFFFYDRAAEKLIARKKEIFDNVIPASNSAMAKNLHELGIITENQKFLELSSKMIQGMSRLIQTEPGYLTNWAILFNRLSHPAAEVAIVGPAALEFGREIGQSYHPNRVLAGAREDSGVGLLKNREAIDGETTIYVCYNRSCKLPVHTTEDAKAQLKESLENLG